MRDDRNKFISISYSFYRFFNLIEEQMVEKGLNEEEELKPLHSKWSFLDFYRLFPLSLQNLC